MNDDIEIMNAAERAANEIDSLRRWKREATYVLGLWEDAFESVKVDEWLPGSSKPALMADEILRLRDRVAKLEANQ